MSYYNNIDRSSSPTYTELFFDAAPSIVDEKISNFVSKLPTAQSEKELSEEIIQWLKDPDEQPAANTDENDLDTLENHVNFLLSSTTETQVFSEYTNQPMPFSKPIISPRELTEEKPKTPAWLTTPIRKNKKSALDKQKYRNEYRSFQDKINFSEVKESIKNFGYYKPRKNINYKKQEPKNITVFSTTTTQDTTTKQPPAKRAKND